MFIDADDLAETRSGAGSADGVFEDIQVVFVVEVETQDGIETGGPDGDVSRGSDFENDRGAGDDGESVEVADVEVAVVIGDDRGNDVTLRGGNVGDAKQEYFADGMTDELITELAKSKGVRVISRTSVMQYKNARRPLRAIGKELGADAIVEGTVALNGSKVRVRVQLIHVATDTHLWAQSYERDVSDVMGLQEELARNIAGELKTTVAPTGRKAKRIDPEAHENYLKGRYAFLSGSGEASREYFEKAITLQSGYAEAYSGLADYYGAGAVGGELDPKKAVPEWEKNAKKALELDATIAEPHHSVAALYFFYGWNWKKAEEEERLAIELNPNISEAYHLLSYILFGQNRVAEAVDAQRRATEVDPFARPWAMGYVLMCAERYAEADAELRRELEVRPTNTDVRDTLATCSLPRKKRKSPRKSWWIRPGAMATRTMRLRSRKHSRMEGIPGCSK